MPVESRYANYFSVGHADCEIVMEFAQYYEGDEQPVPHTRIVTSPLNAVKFIELLKDSLQQYAAERGPIPGAETL